MKQEVGPGLRHSGEPGLQILVPLLCGSGQEVRSDHGMTAVLDTPDEVGRWLSMEGSGVGKPGDVSADLQGFSLVLLELKPLCLSWKGGQALDEMLKGLGLHVAFFLQKVFSHRQITTPKQDAAPSIVYGIGPAWPGK